MQSTDQTTATTSAPGAPPKPMGNIADANNITVLFILLALAVVVLGALALFQFLRRDRHIQSLLDKRHQSPHPPQPRRDAWAEAGRRLEAPSAKDLEDDSTNAGDRDNEKTWTPIPPDANPASTPATKPAAGASRQASKQAPLALVTGGAKRVGRAICLELARSGCDIIFTYNTSEADAASLCREVNALGREATSYRVDLNDLASVEAAASQWAQTLPHLDVLVHNASIYSPTPLNELRAEEAFQHYQINALVPLLLSARLAPLLQHSSLPSGGAIVAMGDIHAMSRPRKDFAAYTMSKAALTELVYCLARDLAPRVRVNAVAPGVVAWPTQGHESTADEQLRYLRRIPLGRAGEPADAAATVCWLALHAPYITGQVIRVDGGRWLT